MTGAHIPSHFPLSFLLLAIACGSRIMCVTCRESLSIPFALNEDTGFENYDAGFCIFAASFAHCSALRLETSRFLA